MALGILASASSTSENSHGTRIGDSDSLDAEVAHTLKENRYDPGSDTLIFTQAQANSFRDQQAVWREYFSAPEDNGGLAAGLIQDSNQLHELTSFSAWAAWASAARRPGKTYSYTNNFPYDPLAENLREWSATGGGNI